MPVINSISDFRKAVRYGKYVWPGGYPTFFICTDGAALCHDCVKQERRSILHSLAYDVRDGWHVAGIDINWEDGQLVCDHCNEHIENAYA